MQFEKKENEGNIFQRKSIFFLQTWCVIIYFNGIKFSESDVLNLRSNEQYLQKLLENVFFYFSEKVFMEWFWQNWCENFFQRTKASWG